MKRKNRNPSPSASKRQKRSGKSSRGIGLATPSYRGPIRTKSDVSQTHKRVVVGQVITPLTFTGAGGINTVIYANPANVVNGSSFPVADWARLVNIYDEYRVLGMSVRYYPINRYNAPLVSSVGPAPLPPIAVVVDRDTSTNLSNYDFNTGAPAASQYDSCELFCLTDKWVKEVRMTDFNDATFINTANPVPPFFIKTFAMGGTASYNCGYLHVLLRIEFRGRGV